MFCVNSHRAVINRSYVLDSVETCQDRLLRPRAAFLNVPFIKGSQHALHLLSFVFRTPNYRHLQWLDVLVLLRPQQEFVELVSTYPYRYFSLFRPLRTLVYNIFGNSEFCLGMGDLPACIWSIWSTWSILIHMILMIRIIQMIHIDPLDPYDLYWSRWSIWSILSILIHMIHIIHIDPHDPYDPYDPHESYNPYDLYDPYDHATLIT